MRKGSHEILLAAALLVAAWRGADLPGRQSLEDWHRPGGGPETFVPDLQQDGVVRLSWLPGVGPYRARRIVEQRPFLQVPLTPLRLGLLSGVGETTAEEVAAWYARQANLRSGEEHGAALE